MHPDNPMARPEEQYEGQREPDFTATIPKMWDNHAMCDHCWHERNPYREAARLLDDGWRKCCFCLQWTHSGIWVRASVLQVKCPVEGHDKEE